MQSKIGYKSFFWSMGTTSFRTRDFNKTIEQQLELLHEFWAQPENQAESWNANNALQSRYYAFMQSKNFVKGDAAKKDKDAREKTSGLVDIGLIDPARRLTEAGDALRKMAAAGDFAPDNFLELPRDSFLYLGQLLKASCKVGGGEVRPFIVLLYLLTQAGQLSLDQFTYLVPLCVDEGSTAAILQGILAGTETTDEILLARLMAQENYQKALALLLENPVEESLLCEVGLNRKSRQYDKPYFALYQNLAAVYLQGKTEMLPRVFDCLSRLEIGALWKEYLFDTTSRKAVQKDPARHQKRTRFDAVQTEQAFKREFFCRMHLFKAKATLADYRDLNRRYFKTADVLLFEDGQVKLSLAAKYYFAAVMPKLYAEAYRETALLPRHCPLHEICPALVPNDAAVIAGLNRDFGVGVTSLQAAHEILENERYARLHHLLDTRFTRENLTALLVLFEQRTDGDAAADAKIQAAVTDNADVPTIFEYVLGILWYQISGRKGRVLDYMQLSLDADLLPKTHAAGGEADIVYAYDACEAYPAHTLLLEATLSEKNNQRRMEMEPVSRHLGRHLIAHPNPHSYCVFAAPYLDYNVLTDFRYRKRMPYYLLQNESQCVKGMKIIPLTTGMLQKILKKGLSYAQLYPIFEKAYRADLEELPPPAWHRAYLQTPLENAK